MRDMPTNKSCLSTYLEPDQLETLKRDAELCGWSAAQFAAVVLLQRPDAQLVKRQYLERELASMGAAAAPRPGRVGRPAAPRAKPAPVATAADGERVCKVCKRSKPLGDFSTGRAVCKRCRADMKTAAKSG